jgi:hypothetical protein
MRILPHVVSDRALIYDDHDSGRQFKVGGSRIKELR